MGDQPLSIWPGRSIHEWVAIPLLDEGEAGFNVGEGAVLDRFRLQLPLTPRATQVVVLHISLSFSLLLGGVRRLSRLINGGSMGLVLIVDLCQEWKPVEPEGIGRVRAQIQVDWRGFRGDE